MLEYWDWKQLSHQSHRLPLDHQIARSSFPSYSESQAASVRVDLAAVMNKKTTFHKENITAILSALCYCEAPEKLTRGLAVLQTTTELVRAIDPGRIIKWREQANELNWRRRGEK